MMNSYEQESKRLALELAVKRSIHSSQFTEATDIVKAAEEFNKFLRGERDERGESDA